MSKFPGSSFHNLSNDEIVDAFNNLKKVCKTTPRISFGKSLKTLGDYSDGRMFDDSTAMRYIDLLKGQRDKDMWLKERSYIIALIEAACAKWNIKKRGINEFIRDGGSSAARTNGTDSFRYEGSYCLYCPASTGHAINKHPLHIDKAGNARIVFRGNGSKDILEGVALFDGHSILSISLFEEVDIKKFKHYIFSVAGQFPPNLKNAFGISLRANQDLRPIARMEVLIASNVNIDSPAVVYEELVIDSDAFREEDIKLAGVLTWLTGKYNRMIVAPSKPNRSYSRRMAEYVDVHFQSACYLALRGHYEESLINLYQAYLHGFDNVALLEKEINEGCLKEIFHSPVKVVPKHSKGHHEALDCKEIAGRIRKRAAHISLLPLNPKDK